VSFQALSSQDRLPEWEGCSTRSKAEAGALAAKKTSVSAAAKRNVLVMLISNLLNNVRKSRRRRCQKAGTGACGRVDDRQ
jgi:hypothetical protein